MGFRDIYLENTTRNILLRGLLALAGGLLVGGIATVVTGENQIHRFAFPIFGIPMLLTVVTLVSSRTKSQKSGPPPAKRSDSP